MSNVMHAHVYAANLFSNYNVFKLSPYMGVDSVEMKNSICL